MFNEIVIVPILGFNKNIKSEQHECQQEAEAEPFIDQLNSNLDKTGIDCSHMMNDSMAEDKSDDEKLKKANDFPWMAFIEVNN